MARVVAYVAVAAAVVSAGALGFSVIWSYEPPEAPPSVSPAKPPVVAAPPATTPELPVPPDAAPPGPSVAHAPQEGAPATMTAPERARLAPPVVVTARPSPGADARRHEAATARERQRSGDATPGNSVPAV